MPYEAADVADMLIAADPVLNKGKLTDLGSDLQEHHMLYRLARKSKVRIGGGHSHTVHTLNEYDDNTRATGMFAVDNINQRDGLKDGSVPWRHITTGLVMDEAQIAMCGGEAEILNFYNVKLLQMLGGHAGKFEQYGWDGPDSATDEVTPFGILRYWLTYNASEGFNGGNHTLWSGGPAGIDCTVYPRWKHWTFNYAAVTKADLVKKARKAVKRTGFVPPVPNGPFSKPEGENLPRRAWYTTDTVTLTMEDLLEAQNDNLGPDLARYKDAVMLCKVPVLDIPYLTQNYATSNPLIGIDWSHLYLAVLKQFWMRKTKPHAAGSQHTVVQQEMDSWYNLIIDDRRRFILGAMSDPMDD